MKNGIEFESKKQVAEFYKDLYENDHEEVVNNFVSTVKERGYIKKSHLEKKKDQYYAFEEANTGRTNLENVAAEYIHELEKNQK